MLTYIFVLSCFSLLSVFIEAEPIEKTNELLPLHPDVPGFPAREEYGVDSLIGCGCYHPRSDLSQDCGCCLVILIPIVSNQLVCNNITYEPGALTFSATMSIGGTTIINGTIDLGNPAPICSDPLLTLGYEICWDFYGIKFTENGMQICSKIVVKWFLWKVYEFDFGCIVLDSGTSWWCDYENNGEMSCSSTCNGMDGITDGYTYRDVLLGTTSTVERVGKSLFNNGCQVGVQPQMQYMYAN